MKITNNPNDVIQPEKEYLEQLQHEIKEFEKEKERIRRVMGELGGKRYASREFIVNIIFIVFAVGLIIAQSIFHLFTSIASIEIAVFMVSIKIIWMIHSQAKHNHFMFWVLNTIEYRINDVYKIAKGLQKHLNNLEEGTIGTKKKVKPTASKPTEKATQ